MKTEKPTATSEVATETGAEATPKAKKAKKEPKAKKVSDGTEKRGRKVKADSARQLRLAKFAAIKAAGGEVKRGRPRKEGAVEKIAKVAKANTAKAAKVKKEKAPKAEA